MMCLLKQSEHGEIFSIEEQMNKNASDEIDLINVIIIIIITTRPRPAFGRLGLDRSSRG